MPRILISLTAFILFCSPLFAQRPDGWQDAFDEGIAALSSGKHDEGIAAFKVCLGLDGEDPTCAYNIACGYSLKDEVDPGIEWLGKAIDWGFAREQSNIDMATSGDIDLANLRKDARFASLVERMKKSLAELTAMIKKEWKEPLIILPEGHEAMNDLGAIIVLHDLGSSKKAIAESFWKDVASELHLVLVVPSANTPIGTTLDQGMAWFTDFEEFRARYWDAEKSIEPAIAAIKQMENVAVERVFMAGQGQGGTVAFNAAMRTPRLYAGILAIDAPLIPNLTESYFPNAISAGVQVRVLVSTESMFGVAKSGIMALTNQTRTVLMQAKLASKVTTYTPSEDKPNLRKDLVIETLREMMSAPKTAPVEAGADK